MAELSTYADIASAVRGLIQDPSGAARLMTDDQMDLWANMCLYEMAEYAEYIDGQDVAPAATVAGGGVISLEGDPLGVWRVEIEDEAIYPINTRELYKLSRTWQEQTGEPRWYYMDSLRDMTSDDVKLRLWPKPNATYTLRVFTTIPADELTTASSTDKVMLPLWATPGLVWGILWRFYESESRMQNLGTSQFYKMMYDQVVERLRVRAFARLQRLTAWGSGPRRAGGDDVRQLMPADGFPYP